jgi:hypothetical protein
MRVAVVEPEDRGLGEQRIVDAEARLLGLEVLQGRVLLPGVDVGEDRVAVAEGSPLAVLPAQADGLPSTRREPKASASPNPSRRAAVPEGLPARRAGA